jgi:hypothetical protein
MDKTRKPNTCPDCELDSGLNFQNVDRRKFLKTTGSVAVVSAALPATLLSAAPQAVDDPQATPETLVKQLYDSMNEKQRAGVCFDWDQLKTFKSGISKEGLLRTRVENNWQVTDKKINSKFYTADQQEIIRAIFDGLYNPEWIPRIEKQLQDDAGGYGKQQSIAIFGKPGGEKFEFVMTGRHLTLRCDGNSTDHVAFGGPLFYGHAASEFNEPADHPGNVFWPQALAANKVFEMLDGKQRKLALLEKRPNEQAVAFQGDGGTFPGIPITELSNDQKQEMQKVLAKLIEPYRDADRAEAMQCLQNQGGLDKCSLAFYSQGDIGDDKTWDNWRLEGPSFVWYFRGSPHVHVWVNVAADASVKTNT